MANKDKDIKSVLQKKDIIVKSEIKEVKPDVNIDVKNEKFKDNQTQSQPTKHEKKKKQKQKLLHTKSKKASNIKAEEKDYTPQYKNLLSILKEQRNSLINIDDKLSKPFNLNVDLLQNDKDVDLEAQKESKDTSVVDLLQEISDKLDKTQKEDEPKPDDKDDKKGFFDFLNGKGVAFASLLGIGYSLTSIAKDISKLSKMFSDDKQEVSEALKDVDTPHEEIKKKLIESNMISPSDRKKGARSLMILDSIEDGLASVKYSIEQYKDVEKVRELTKEELSKKEKMLEKQKEWEKERIKQINILSDAISLTSIGEHFETKSLMEETKESVKSKVSKLMEKDIFDLPKERGVKLLEDKDKKEMMSSGQIKLLETYDQIQKFDVDYKKEMEKQSKPLVLDQDKLIQTNEKMVLETEKLNGNFNILFKKLSEQQLNQQPTTSNDQMKQELSKTNLLNTISNNNVNNTIINNSNNQNSHRRK